jgi:hypothetical protein
MVGYHSERDFAKMGTFFAKNEFISPIQSVISPNRAFISPNANLLPKKNQG